MISDLGLINNDADVIEANNDDDDDDNASFSSEDSQEIYYHVVTGKICPAREAWKVLAAEGHPRYKNKLSGASASSKKDNSNSCDKDKPTPSISNNHANNNNNNADSTPSTPIEEYPETEIENVASFSGPSQSSIDMALHPHSPNYISPNKDLKNAYKKTGSYGSAGASGVNSTTNIANIMDIPAPSDDEDDKETDSDILRAKAMALAAQNGQKLTPEQMQLIAQPDVQQQKLIEEAKRVHKAKIEHSQHGGGPAAPFQQIGADFKKFIEQEKDKTPLQWGADLGKFIETQSMKIGSQVNLNANVNGGEGTGEGGVDGEKDGGGEVGDGNASAAASSATTPAASPRPKKKMEGFGTDPLAPRVSPGRSSLTPNPSSSTTDDKATALTSTSSKWPSMKMGMPPLPMLNDSITGITNILPIVGSNSKSDDKASVDSEEPVRISGILWKRRSGFGKHSTLNAWERRRVELRGSKIMYYKSAEEEKEEREDAAAIKDAAAKVDSNHAENTSGNGQATPRDPPSESADGSEATPTIGPGSMSKRSLSIFGQAAQAAEQRLQNAKDELSRFATVTGLEHLSKPSSSSAEKPRGVLDLRKENVSVSASVGHSGAPTPFCISIKVKSETKWKFCFDSRGVLMEWLSASTDVLVKKSADYKATKHDEVWELEDYCIRSGGGGEKANVGEVGGNNGSSTALSAGDVVVASGAQHSIDTVAVSGKDETQWMISGTNLQIAWAVANVALIIARSSSTSVDRYWMLIVFTNVGLWQLCARPKGSKSVRFDESSASGSIKPIPFPGSPIKAPRKIPSKPKPGYKPIAGNTTMQVAKADDPNINKNGDQLPSWIPISSDTMDVRSHGYLSTKKKIPSPGELYECVAVDTFVSNARFPNIAPRVHLPLNVKFEEDSAAKTWKSPDIFIVSISLPTEAPRFGQSTDDGPGLNFVGYFKMKEETRKILRRITADGYDPSTDTSDSEVGVQKRITNGVRLWEKYCNQAPNDPSFQARFKLIPSANIEDLGCPSYIAKYNGKPVLIKRNQVTGFFTDYPSLNVMEFDISLHPFPYLFKQAMAYLKDYFDKVQVSFGFVIEGRNDDELPEVVIGGMKVCRPSPNFIVKGEEFFDGTCPKSTVQESD